MEGPLARQIRINVFLIVEFQTFLTKINTDKDYWYFVNNRIDTLSKSAKV